MFLWNFNDAIFQVLSGSWIGILKEFVLKYGEDSKNEL